MIIQVLGYIWEPGKKLCSYKYNLNEKELQDLILTNKNLKFNWSSGLDFFRLNLTREMVGKWLEKNAGDFSAIEDFCVFYDGGVILEWEKKSSKKMYASIV